MKRWGREMNRKVMEVIVLVLRRIEYCDKL